MTDDVLRDWKCLDCGRDISMRPGPAKRCVLCAEAHARAKRRARDAQRKADQMPKLTPEQARAVDAWCTVRLVKAPPGARMPLADLHRRLVAALVVPGACDMGTLRAALPGTVRLSYGKRVGWRLLHVAVR